MDNSTITSYKREDNQPNPLPFPDLSHLSKNSRIGRKLRRKAVDGWAKAERLATGRPAQSGPPIPNSEHTGHRRFFTLEQAHTGTIHSAINRQAKAEPKHRQAFALRAKGYTTKTIAAIVGYSRRHVRRVLAQPVKTLAERLAWAKRRIAAYVLESIGHKHSNHRMEGRDTGDIATDHRLRRAWIYSECLSCGRVAQDRRISVCPCGGRMRDFREIAHVSPGDGG